MGCCETRDEVLIKEEKPKKKTSKIINFSQMQDQDFLYVPDRSPLSKQLNLSNNSSSLRLYIEWCKSIRKWNEMIEHLGDFTQLTETQQYISWAREPKSISSLIVTYLYLALQKDSTTVLKYVESVIIEVVRLMAGSSEDFRDCSLFLISSYLDFSNEKVIKSLVRYGIFEVLTGFLTNIDSNVRLLSIEIATRVYNNRAYAQVNFVENDGLIKFLVLLRDPDSSEKFLCIIIEAAALLVKLEEIKVNKRVLSAMKDLLLPQVLKDLQVKFINVSSECNELLDLLSNE